MYIVCVHIDYVHVYPFDFLNSFTHRHTHTHTRTHTHTHTHTHTQAGRKVTLRDRGNLILAAQQAFGCMFEYEVIDIQLTWASMSLSACISPISIHIDAMHVYTHRLYT